MMNYIWGGMMIIGIVYGAVTGNMQSITDGMLTSVKEAVTLSIAMLGIVGFWSGLMEISVEAGIMETMTRALQPLLHFLFPKIPKGHPSLSLIATNFVANILGLGWAATPAGLKAIQELANLEKERGNKEESHTASDEMCTFLVMNISSLQLIPVNIIAYRSQYGSVNPAGIIVPAMLVTLLNSLAALIFCKIKTKKTCL